MKHNKHHNNAKPPGSEMVSVRFEFVQPTAHSVFLAGSFNDWQPAPCRMDLSRDGHWLKETTLPPGTYEYRWVVDGKWMNDPQSTEIAPNPFGSANSVIHVHSPRAIPRLDVSIQPPNPPSLGLDHTASTPPATRGATTIPAAQRQPASTR